MNSIDDNSFDKEFSEISVLRWDPWVGRNYATSSSRILVAGESHYVHDNGKGEDGYGEMLRYSTKRQVTRDVIHEVMYEQCWRNRTLARIPTVLFGSQFDGNAFDQIAYYNFIQRPMDYRIKERPTSGDNTSAWECFESLVLVLRPNYVVFVGVTASKFLGHISSSRTDLLQWHEPINGVAPRTASLSVSNQQVHLVFMKHFSQFFSQINGIIFWSTSCGPNK